MTFPLTFPLWTGAPAHVPWLLGAELGKEGLGGRGGSEGLEGLTWEGWGRQKRGGVKAQSGRCGRNPQVSTLLKVNSAKL